MDRSMHSEVCIHLLVDLLFCIDIVSRCWITHRTVLHEESPKPEEKILFRMWRA